jgi:putative spermidine/putrescine transport system substrate-binding protein
MAKYKWSRRRFLKTSTGVAALGVFSGFHARSARAAPSLKGTGSVIVFDGAGAWGVAQRAAYFEPFEKETGIKAIAAPRGPAGKFRASILAGAPAYDVADISGGTIGTFLKDGLLMPIDYQFFDPADKAGFKPVTATEFMVPALIFSLVVAYDAEKFAGRAPRTWADLWDTKTFAGPRTISVGNQGPGGGTYEIALLADGVTPDNLYPLDWDRALKSLDKLKPSILKFWGAGAEPAQALVDKNAALASAWNGRIADVQAQGAKVGYSWEQGILQWDAWVVPKGAVNAENAMKFLAFASRPDRQAQFAELITYGPTNSRAYEHIKPARAGMLPTAPENRDRQIVQNYEWWDAEARPGITNDQRATEIWEKWVTNG